MEIFKRFPNRNKVLSTKFTLINNVLYILCLLILNLNVLPIDSQLVGSEKTMEQFLDRLLHESVYDRRIRPFYTDSKGKILFRNYLRSN